MTVLTKTVSWEEGTINMGGTKAFFYATAARNILTYPVLADDDITLNGDIVLKDGTLFIKVYCTQGTGSIVTEGQGERDGGSFKNMMGWNTPGNEKNNVQFAREIINGTFIILGFDTSGYMRLLGDTDFPAYRETIEGTSGVAATDKKGYQYLISSDNPRPAPFYEGSLDGLILIEPVATDATAITNSGFTANWLAVSGATSYALDVSTSPKFTSFVAGYEAKEINGITEAVTGLAADTVYYYRVRSLLGLYESDNSNTIPVKTIT